MCAAPLVCGGKMITPSTPCAQEVSLYVVFKGIHIISDGSYNSFVQQQASKQEPWACAMNNAVDKVEAFISFWRQHIDLVSKRELSGMARLCRNVQSSNPICKKNFKLSIENCGITKLQSRPCFEMKHTRSGEQSLWVHHSLFSSCQSLWAMVHTQSILSCLIAKFLEKLQSTTLSDICTEFENSECKMQLCEYLNIVFDDVNTIFTQDQNMLLCAE
jgi:hypothetical protein